MDKFKVVVMNDTIYDVEVQPDGGWLFKWKCETSGTDKELKYESIFVAKHLNNGNWKVIEADKQPVIYTTDDYAAAFNMWQDDFVNNPQAFEDSHTTAIRHLTEKLNGEEPSYGMVCSVLFQEYLNKVSNTTREGK